jgi:integrase
MALASKSASSQAWRLGHATISITLDTYSHVLPSLQREAASKLDDLLRGSA